MKAKDFGFLFWLHLLLLIIAYFSPLLFRWQIIAIGVLLLYVQQILIDGCFLTHFQFGRDRYMTFYYHYLTLLGFEVNKKNLKFLMAYIMPLVILIIAMVLQLIFNINPLLF